MPCYHSARDAGRIVDAGYYFPPEAGVGPAVLVPAAIVAAAIAAGILPETWNQWAYEQRIAFLQTLPSWAQQWLVDQGVHIPEGPAPTPGYPANGDPTPPGGVPAPTPGQNGVAPPPGGAIVVPAEDEKMPAWQWAAIGVGAVSIVGLGVWALGGKRRRR